MATPHNLANKGDIAQTVLLPGDPLRAKLIAETFLENPVQFNQVRNMFGYTGTFQGKPVSVMGTGMGCPSIGIYTYELIHFYDVKNLIRIGSCGAMQESLELGDIVIALQASTDSNYAAQYKLPGTYSAGATWEILAKAVERCEANGVRYQVGGGDGELRALLQCRQGRCERAGALHGFRLHGLRQGNVRRRQTEFLHKHDEGGAGDGGCSVNREIAPSGAFHI